MEWMVNFLIFLKRKLHFNIFYFVIFGWVENPESVKQDIFKRGEVAVEIFIFVFFNFFFGGDFDLGYELGEKLLFIFKFI
jgi:hypothetical protein